MATEKEFRARLQQKHETAENWSKAENFVPKVGEIVVYDKYDKDGNQVADEVKMKIGDGVTNVKELPFFGGTVNVSIGDLPLATGSGDNSIQFGEAKANGDYSLAGGTNSEDVITGIVGETISEQIPAIALSEANGSMSISHGAGSVTHSSGSNAFGVKNQSGFLGYYIHEVSSDKKTLTLSTSQARDRVTPNSSVLGLWEPGYIVFIINNSTYTACGEIDSVNANDGTVTMKDVLPFDVAFRPVKSIDYKLGTYNVDIPEAPHDRSIIALPPINKIEYKHKLDLGILGTHSISTGEYFDTYRAKAIGEVELGFSSTTFGFDNAAIGSISTAFGMHNVAHGTASFVTGRENIGGWGSFVGGYKNEVLGDTASATGRSNVVSGSNATANGASNKAIGRNSHAEGLYTISAGERSHSEGYSSNQLETTPATTEEAIATFETTKFSMAFGAQSHVEGRDTLALKDGSHSEGRETISNGLQAHAEGYRSQALANTSHAEGSGTKATGVASHAEGSQTESRGKYSHAEGLGTIASGEAQHVSGKYNEEDSNALFIIGNGTKDIPSNIITVDETSLKIYGNTHDQYDIYRAECYGDQINIKHYGYEGEEYIKLHPKLFDINSSYSDEQGLMLGNGIQIDSNQIKFYEENRTWDSAGGEGNGEIFIEVTSEILTAQDVSKLHSLPTEFIGRPGEGENAEVFNGSSKALGTHSHAEGGSTIAYGNYSHTEGQQTMAGEEGANPADIGLGAHAEGMFTLARGARSHAEGNRTVAYGAQGHTEGIKTTALGSYSHAEGQSSYPALGSLRAADNNPALFSLDADNNTIHAAWKTQKFSLAKGEASHVEGLNNLALGSKSHVEGSNNIASADYQHVQGRFNARDDSMVHIVGWGNSESNRKNIHTIDKSGNAWFAGEITVGALKEEVVLKSELNSLDEKIGEISTILDHIIQLQEELIG